MEKALRIQRVTNYAAVTEHLRVVRGGREVLHQVSLSLVEGTVTGLVGPSGCGKTTLMRAIVGVQATRSGTVTVLGAPAGSPGLRRHVGYATQSPAVYADLSVVENLRYFTSVLGAGREAAERALEEVGLAAERNRQVSQLSGGQLSRASLAVALLAEPRLLVLDEPTVGLDPVLREQLWNLFRRLSHERAVSLLISSHVMDEAARCERLILMRDGAILAHETPEALNRLTGTDNVEQAFLRLVKERTVSEVGT